MNIKEAIEVFLDNVVRTLLLDEVGAFDYGGKYGVNKKVDEVIELLKRGKKYEAMFNDIGKHQYTDIEMEKASIKADYFPEPIKKIMIIEIEANDEEIIRDQFQILSTQLFKNRQGKKSRRSFGYVIKYKEGD